MNMNEEVELDFAALQQQIESLKESMENRSEKEKIVRARISELTREITALTKERISIEDSQRVAKTTLRTLESDVVKAARLHEVKERQKRLQEEFEAKAAELDKLTADAKWRSFAFKHQIEGGKRLAVAKRGILGDKRGLGKTLTSLVWSDMVQGKKVLVLAPNDVVSQFEGEIREWTPDRTIFSMRGMNKSQRDMVYGMMNLLDEFIITLNYEAWRKDKGIISHLLSLGIDTLILDEAHRIKSSDKVTARGVFQVAYRPNSCPRCKKIVDFDPWTGKNDRYIFWHNNDRDQHVCSDCATPLSNTIENVLCMTGTPILNKPQEMFSMLFLIDPVAFPSEAKFLSDYCYMGMNNRWQFHPGGVAKLTEAMSTFFLQRGREDTGITVPPPAITIHRLEKDVVKYAKQYEAEKAISKAASIVLDDGTQKDFFFLLEIILRERQCMVWPAGIEIKDPETKEVLARVDVEESQKLDAAEELLSELMEEGERVIVFSQFKAPLYEMERRMQKSGYRPVMATGDQTDYQKELIKRDFDLKFASKDNYRFDVCFATYKAFGTGINLNAARHLIILDDEWNPGNEDQAIGRIDRLNSEDQANVHIFRVQKSIDDFMEQILEEKRGIVSGFNESISASELMTMMKNRK